MRKLVLAAVAVLALTSCAKAGLGEECSETSDCGDSKTQCIPYGAFTTDPAKGPTCVDTQRICSVTCDADTDCAVLGDGHICVKDCFLGSCVKGSRG